MGKIHSIRNAARAVIIHNDKLLTIKMRDQNGIFYILPGGGQLPGETLFETLRRECAEEIGVSVIVDNLIYLRDYIGKNHTFSENHSSFHQLEAVFKCHIDNPETVCNGHQIDKKQVGVEWLSIGKLNSERFFPKAVKSILCDQKKVLHSLYLGDIN